MRAWASQSCVCVQVFGGLIVGMVVKYADNILKNFANALSVIFTVIGAVPLFHQYPSGWFIVGVAAVMLSVFMYGKSTPQVSICCSSLSGRTMVCKMLHEKMPQAHRLQLWQPEKHHCQLYVVFVRRSIFELREMIISTSALACNTLKSARTDMCNGGCYFEDRWLWCEQGYETFEACFKTLAGRNLLPSTMEDTAGIMRWLSPLRRRPDSAADKDRDGRARCSARGTATRVILIASSIAILIAMIALTHHPRTQARTLPLPCPFPSRPP